jgi:hypothetical protein
MSSLSGRNGARQRPVAALALALLSLSGPLAKKVKLAAELTLTGVKFAHDTKAGMDAIKHFFGDLQANVHPLQDAWK